MKSFIKKCSKLKNALINGPSGKKIYWRKALSLRMILLENPLIIPKLRQPRKTHDVLACVIYYFPFSSYAVGNRSSECPLKSPQGHDDNDRLELNANERIAGVIRLEGANNAFKAKTDILQQSITTTNPVKTTPDEGCGCYNPQNQHPASCILAFYNHVLRTWAGS